MVTFGVGSRCSSWAPWSFTVGSWLGLARSLAVVFGVGYSRTLRKKDQWCLKVVSALPAVGVSGLSGLQVLLSCWGFPAVGWARPGAVRVGPSASPGQCVPGLSGCPGFSCLSGLVSGLSGLSLVVGWAGLSRL